MTERLIDQREWEAQERYLRFRSASDGALAAAHDTMNRDEEKLLMARGMRLKEQAQGYYDEWQSLIKERESK